ncbi:MAG: hypothetical protein AcusKO_46410 [Acuticoccus sp.]
MRIISAAMLLLACLALLWVLWDVTWDALSSLPERGSAALPSASSGAPPAEPNSIGVSTFSREPAAEETAPPAPARQPEPETASTSTPANVRFVEGQGIIGPRIDGTLVRLPAAVPEAPPPPPPELSPELYRLVVIESAGTIDARTHKVRLAHVDTPAPGATCRNADGSQWPCGMRARTALRRLIRRRAIACIDPDAAPGDPPRPLPAPGEVRVEACTVGNVNLSEWLVENGWAAPVDGAPGSWRELNAAAQAGGRGLYATAGR